MRCIKTGGTATIGHTRYHGDLFLLPPLGDDQPGCTDRYHGPQLDMIEMSWALLVYVGTRTAVENWHDFGHVDHCSAPHENHRFGNDSRGQLLLEPGKWTWLGYDGQPCAES